MSYCRTVQVKGVMVSNIEKVTQRGDKLDDLGERAGQLYLNSGRVLYRKKFSREKNFAYQSEGNILQRKLTQNTKSRVGGCMPKIS